MKVEMSDIPIKSLVPDALKDWKPKVCVCVVIIVKSSSKVK